MTEKRFYYDWKTGRMKDTQSNSLATSDMRILETIINDACYSYEKSIKKLETRNKQQHDSLKTIFNLMYARDWKALENIVEGWEESDRLLHEICWCFEKEIK